MQPNFTQSQFLPCKIASSNKSAIHALLGVEIEESLEQLEIKKAGTNAAGISDEQFAFSLQNHPEMQTLCSIHDSSDAYQGGSCLKLVLGDKNHDMPVLYRLQFYC